MKTSEDVYYRILSDSSLNPTFFTITYYDAIKDKYIDTPALQFKPIKNGGDIPWSRVYYIKYNNKVVWDRLNLIYDLSECFNNNEKKYLPENFNIMTFNIMSDIYDKHITDFIILKRGEKIIKMIDELNFDLICLQEVTPLIKKMLEKLNYIITITSLKGINELVILSKIPPINVEIKELNSQKQIIIAEFELNDTTKLKIINFHLTSDSREDASSTRLRQINMIKNQTSESDILIILGDTNESNRISQFNNLLKCETNHSYNPDTNHFAGIFSKKGIKCHFDRIYYSNNNLICNNSEVVENNELSDHYPVIANFSLCERKIDNINERLTLTKKTAFSIIPPYEIQKTLPQYNENWMPHLNIFWPFLQMKDVNQYYKLFDEIKFEPFTIIFDSYGKFDHDTNMTIYLKMRDSDAEKIQKLREKWISICPILNSNFVPHLSLYKIKKSASYKLPILTEPISFEIKSFHIISREETDLMQVERIIGNADYTNSEIINFLSNFSKDVKICGSNIFLENNVNTDLDLVCTDSVDRNIFFNRLYLPLRQCGMFLGYDIIMNKHIHELKILCKNKSVDLQYFNPDKILTPHDISAFRLIENPLTILSYVKDKKLFKECLSFFRNFCKENNIYGQVYGYLCGINLAIMTCHVINKYECNSLEEFILNIKNLNGDSIISCTGKVNYYEHESKVDDLMIVIIDDRSKNTIRNMTKTTKSTILNVFSGISVEYTHMSRVILKCEDLDMCSRKIVDINKLIIKFLIKLERCGISLKNDNKWNTKIKDNLHVYSYLIEYNATSNMFDYYFDKFTRDINLLLDSSFIFSFVNRLK